MRREFLIKLLIISQVLGSCSILDNGDPDPYSALPSLKSDGAFIINEGNFLAGNGSLSFFSNDSVKIYNDLFSELNGRPLGDIPFSMVIHDSKAYIIVNNSGKIEVLDLHTLKSIAMIRNISSPRCMLVVGQEKAYVTSLYSKEITVINLKTNTVSGKINIHRTSESMVRANNKVYVSCWTSTNKLMIIDPAADQLVDSVEVGYEPESMVLDNENKLWILCSGGYSGEHYPELLSVNTVTDKIEKRFVFSSRYSWPSSLAINETGDMLYYISGGIYRFGTSSASLPEKPFIPPKGRLFYRTAIQPVTGYIFATNAVDYQQRGYLIRFNPDGSLIDSVKADIIPGSICFKNGI
jgi:DNA-binding beta-propeller fold protein YncE